jgi:hypothetical protein
MGQAERIHVVLDREEKERYRRLANREGKSLSEWLRDAARERVERSRESSSIDTAEGLRAFFDECDERESGREPDWEEHLQVIRHSISGTGSPT